MNFKISSLLLTSVAARAVVAQPHVLKNLPLRRDTAVSVPSNSVGSNGPQGYGNAPSTSSSLISGSPSSNSLYPTWPAMTDSTAPVSTNPSTPKSDISSSGDKLAVSSIASSANTPSQDVAAMPTLTSSNLESSQAPTSEVSTYSSTPEVSPSSTGPEASPSSTGPEASPSSATPAVSPSSATPEVSPSATGPEASQSSGAPEASPSSITPHASPSSTLVASPSSTPTSSTCSSNVGKPGITSSPVGEASQPHHIQPSISPRPTLIHPTYEYSDLQTITAPVTTVTDYPVYATSMAHGPVVVESGGRYDHIVKSIGEDVSSAKPRSGTSEAPVSSSAVPATPSTQIPGSYATSAVNTPAVVTSREQAAGTVPAYSPSATVVTSQRSQGAPSSTPLPTASTIQTTSKGEAPSRSTTTPTVPTPGSPQGYVPSSAGPTVQSSQLTTGPQPSASGSESDRLEDTDDSYGGV